MRVLFYGSKYFDSLAQLEKIISQSDFKITTVVSTGNLGISDIAEQYAARKQLAIYPIQITSISNDALYNLIDAAILVHNNFKLCEKIKMKCQKFKKPFFEVYFDKKYEPPKHMLNIDDEWI